MKLNDLLIEEPQVAPAARNVVHPLAETLCLSLIPRLSKRLSAVFLGAEVDQTTRASGDLVARIMGQCLDGYVRQLGGQIVYVTDFDSTNREVESSADYLEVDTGQGIVQVLVNGYAFIDLPTERVVVRFYREFRLDGDVIAFINVRANDPNSTFVDGWRAYTRRHNYLRGQAFFADGTLIRPGRTYGWQDIILADSVRAALQTHVEGFLSNLPRLRELGLKTRRGLILTGPPGTGKTLLGKVLSSVLGQSFIWVMPRHVQSPRILNDVIELARLLSPAVLFMEDIDLYAEDRDSSYSPILGELMNQLDGVRENEGILTLATTNRLSVVESALRNRPGRFDRVLDLGAPDAICRRRLLERLLVKARMDEANLNSLAERTDGYTGAQLEELVNTIFLLALDGSPQENGHPAVSRDIIQRALQEIGGKHRRPIGFR